TGVNWVDHDYMETFGIQLAEGRFFSRDHSTDGNEACVVNEAAVRAMGITEPVGMLITLAPNSSIERKKRIIGVMKDFNTESAHGEIRPFLLELAGSGRYMCVRTSGGGAAGAIDHIRKTVSSISPDSNVWCRYFDEEVSRLYRAEMLTGRVVGWITFIAVAISCLGLFGLAAFTAERKTKEIGVRKVLGASETSIVRMMFGEFSVLVLISSLVACPVSLLIMRKWLQNYAFRTTISPLVFLSVTIMALVLAGMTVSFQAVRAARLDPAKVLKHE
ncbi:MAG TPA: FtsX-like permease family protein, partial [Candidatus Krumholzibacterium sp.]|nr:FtsX-like permease family protein [Candidatus Krumholzibacterium sp.]